MSTKRIVIDALFIAIIAIVTAIIALPIGTFGYINLSDAIIMALSVYLGPFDLFLVGSIGASLADIALGYTQYAIFTFAIKGIEALIIAYTFKSKRPLAYVLGAVWMLVGYGLVDVLLGQDILLFGPSIIANLPQALISVIAASILYIPLKRALERSRHGQDTY